MRFKNSWCVGKVIGEEGGKLTVKYADGIVAHDNLHTVGCRIRKFKRKIDMDELYKASPWMKCPFEGGDEGCVCWPCRTGKWPRRYEEGNLSQ